MARPKGSRNVQKLDFEQKWDKLSKSLKVDPVRMLFRIAKGTEKTEAWGPTHRIDAIKLLMSYRYPKLRAIEHTIADDSAPISFRWADERDGDLS